MRRAITISTLALLLLSIRALPQQAPATGVLEGTVVRADTGEPIANAQVSLTIAPIGGLPGVPGAGIVTAGAASATAGAVGAFETVSFAGAPPPPQTGGAPNATNRPATFQPVTTGVDGKFSFKDLNAGSYRVSATANGFVRQEYGQRALNGQGRPVFVTAGQIVKDAAIRLTATGTVSGRVYDENGQPATGAPVQLLRAVYNPQGRNLQVAGTGNTDDRGDYRVYGVPPGRYYLLAGTPPGPPRPVSIGGGPVTVGSARFSMVYYPNTADLDQASTIEVKAGAEASFDMRVRRQAQGYRVRGRVIDSTGTTFPQNVNVMLGYRYLNGGGSFSTGRNFDPATGTFEIRNVAPGDYTVQIQLPEQNPPVLLSGPIDLGAAAARQAALASRPSAYVSIRVVDADIDGVVLNLTAGATVSGRFLVEGQPLSVLPNIQQLSVQFAAAVPRSPGIPLPAGLPAAADGTFQIQGLRDGEYRVTLRGGPNPATSGFYVKSIQYGGDDVLTKPFKFSGSGSGTFEVTLRSGVAQVSGNVTDAQSQPVPGIQVVLIPGQRNRADLIRLAITDQNGRFSLTAITPGEYRLFSWESIDNGAFYDPEFVKQYEQQGKTIQVAESSNQNVDVKLIPAP